MPALTASAPGKVILYGEHAVVYNRPAVAVPVFQVRARAVVTALPQNDPGTVEVHARDIGLRTTLDRLPADYPLALLVQTVKEKLGVPTLPALRIEIHSTIPIASGLGSGAAVSVAIARALSAFLGHPLSDEDVSSAAYRVDQRLHGTPSGIDNTVITYAQPIFFVRGQPFERLKPGQPFTLVIGNTGVSSPTGDVVSDVRRRWQESPQDYENLFDEIAAIALSARSCIENGPVRSLGPLMSQNHALLQRLDVSSPELDRLVNAALEAGAAGAKLCGGGRGGNMVALADPENVERITAALKDAGAVHTITTTIPT